MKRRIRIPGQPVSRAPMPNRFADATLRYVLKNDVDIHTPDVLRELRVMAGMSCYYYLYPDHPLVILAAIKSDTSQVMSSGLLEDDTAVFVQNQSLLTTDLSIWTTGFSTTFIVRVKDMDNNVRWIPAPLLKPA